MGILSRFVRWCAQGSDEQTMSREWMDNYLAAHVNYTESQAVPGMALIEADSSEMARREFWQRVAAPRALPDNVVEMRRK